MEQASGYPGDEPELPEGFMTLQQYARANALPDSEAEFLIRAAADRVNRFNEELGRQIPGIEAPPPIHRYVQRSGDSEPTLYFDPSRLSELMGQIHGDTKHYGETD